MPNKTAPLGTLRRRAVSLLTALTFLVLAVTGVLAFIQPFSIGIIGLHALMGFVFIALIGPACFQQQPAAASYLRSKDLVGHPRAHRPSPCFSGGNRPGQNRARLERQPRPGHGALRDARRRHGLRLQPIAGLQNAAHRQNRPLLPPTAAQVAIWLENQGGYHIKTLLAPPGPGKLPYWPSNTPAGRRPNARPESGEIDAVSSPTPNGSFDPADYILPGDSEGLHALQPVARNQPTRRRTASLVHAVEIDNSLPRHFQLLELRGYPKREENEESGKESWGLYYVDESFGSALDLIDSALLTIESMKATRCGRCHSARAGRRRCCGGTWSSSAPRQAMRSVQ
jgi:hypothetical protein